MCGIAGTWHPRQSRPDLAALMTQKLAHRGPDAEGYWSNQYCALGHRRLKIQDLRDEANQPMISADGNWALVFNGEIYNFRNLAQTHLPHHSFRTQSDTEVILEGFAYYGLDFIHQLNGMFALALYHLSSNTLWLFKDAAGIKPLMYTYWEGGVAFGSEIKALLAIPNLDLSLNDVALELYLQLGYIPSPHSIYSTIFKLEPGKALKVNQNGFELFTWAQPQSIKNLDSKAHTAKDIKIQLKETLRNAVKRQLVADVPVGIFLSSGIDSSTIAAIAAEQSSQQIKTFSIGFGNYDSSELKTAKDTSRALGSNHTEYLLDSDDIKHWLSKLQDIYDEPYADSSSIPTLLISQQCSKEVKVALSGDGSDELFMGYGIYQWAARRSNPFFFAAGRILDQYPCLLNSERASKLRKMMETNCTLDAAHIFSVEHGFFTLNEARHLLLHESNSIFAYTNYYPSHDSPEENQALFDRKYYLPDDLLKKVDRASMYSALEVRVPFLDEEVQQFAASIPMNLKIHKGQRKYILKLVLKDFLPEYDIYKPKRGFSIPLSNWLSNDLSFLIDKWLCADQVITSNVVNPDVVAKMVLNFRLGATYLYPKIWLLIVLHQFMYKYKTSHTL